MCMMSFLKIGHKCAWMWKLSIVLWTFDIIWTFASGVNIWYRGRHILNLWLNIKEHKLCRRAIDIQIKVKRYTQFIPMRIFCSQLVNIVILQRKITETHLTRYSQLFLAEKEISIFWRMLSHRCSWRAFFNLA